MLDHMGVEHRSRCRSLMFFLKSWEVLSMVLMVQTWHSMKPLDYGKWLEEVIWSL